MNPELSGLFTACAQAHEFDVTPWLILADWLDEHYDPRGEFVRLTRGKAVFTTADRIAAKEWCRAHPSRSCLLLDEEDDQGWLTHQVSDSPSSHMDWDTVDWPTRMRLQPSDCASLQAQLAGIPAAIRPWVRVEIGLDEMPIDLDELRDIQELHSVDGLWLLYEDIDGGEFASLMLLLPNLRSLNVTWDDRTMNADLRSIIAASRIEYLTLYQVPSQHPENLLVLGNVASLRRIRIDEMSDVNADLFETWNPNGQLRAVSLDRIQTPEIISIIGRWDGLLEISLQNLSAFPANSLDPLARLTTLNRIDLSDSKTPVSPSLIEQFAQFHGLRELNLRHVADLDDETIHPLGQSKLLELLDLSGNDGLTDLALDSIAQISPLRWLRLYKCGRISRDARERFRQQRPDCRLEE